MNVTKRADRFEVQCGISCAHCAAHPDLKGLSGTKALESLQKVAVLSPIGKKQLSWYEMFPDSDDPAVEFVTTWSKVRVPVGQDILVYADGMARDKPLKLRNPISEEYTRFLSIAFHLQYLRAGDYINLPVARLGEILGVNERTVSNYTQQARKEGYLTLLQKHHQASGTAAKYTFACERFSAETDEEVKADEESHFHKDLKDFEEFKDSEDSNDQREKVRTAREIERTEGLSGIAVEKERNLGISGVETPLKTESIADRERLLKMQATHLEKRKGKE